MSSSSPAPRARARRAPAAAPAPQPSSLPASQPGMGAIPHPGGVTFRVWAPHATAVAVMGSFNDWAADTLPLQAEAEGYWAADIPGAQAGDEYKFVLQTSTGPLTRNDPYARAVTSSGGNSVVFDPADFDWGADDFRMPAWNELVIYELHVGTFHAPDPGRPGTFHDVIARLDYLRELGVNALEIMPATEFPGARSWGYNPANPFALETDYGGPAAFRELVRAAHQHGMAVILDVVYNHFGPDDLDLWQFDGWQENEGGGIYFYNDWRAETPWGHNRPDYGRPAVRQYIRDNALMWLEDYRCDGLRCDAIAYVRNVHGTDDPGADLPDGWSLMRWINEEIRQRQPWKITIAEDLRGNPAITGALEEGGQGFGAQWDGAFVYPLREALTAASDADRDLGEVSRAITTTYNNDAFQRVIYTESHDEVANGKSRLPEEIMPGAVENYYPKKRAALGASLVLTSPGIPMLFQGQEFLAEGHFSDTAPLRWERATEFRGLVQLYRDLIALRRNLRGTTPGLRGQGTRVFHVNDQDKVLAFARWDDQEANATLVLANFADRSHDDYPLALPAPGRWLVRFNSDWQGYDQEFEDFDSFGTEAQVGELDGYNWHGRLGLGPYAVLILSRG